MPYRYTVLGAGRQGVAAAYDLALHGEAERVVLADVSYRAAEEGAHRLNRLVDGERVFPVQVDVNDPRAVRKSIAHVQGMLSAVPFVHNEALTRLAVEEGVHMVDLGGHTGVVRRQLAWHEKAQKAGISVVPDCGMGPGMNVTLALAAMDLLEEPREVRIYDGGLPQEARPPWGYSLLFNVEGLLNEYEGCAHYLRGGQIVQVPALTELEELDLPPLGRLEAFVTSGGLSTMPWTFTDSLVTLENKTLRYRGHCAAFRAFKEAGLFSPNPVRAAGTEVAPRELLKALLGQQLTDPDVRDVCVIHVRARGAHQGGQANVCVQLVDRHDPTTGFTAMEKLTGWHAAIVLEHAARGELGPGAVPVEIALHPEAFLKAAPSRGWHVESHLQHNGRC